MSGPGAGSGPRRPLDRLSRLELALEDAADADTVARTVLRDLGSLPEVSRVGIALSEGGGRRLRFLATDSGEWCHIDAYDDVPLTSVVRTGEPVLGNLDGLGGRLDGRFAGLVERQRAAGTRALAALPLPGDGAAIGGIIVFFGEEQEFADSQRRLLDAAARRTSEALRRIRADLVGDERAEAAEGAATSVVLALDDDPRAVGAARRFLRAQLTEWQVGGDAPDVAELCLSELVTNAVIHAGTSSVLTLALTDGVLTVTVRDRGAAEPVRMLEDDDPLRVFGRGLQLVDALATRWGADHDPTGTTSWFALEVATDAQAASG